MVTSPKNPQLADELILRALKKKYGEDVTLSPLDDSQEKAANDYIYNRFVKKKIKKGLANSGLRLYNYH